jgi:ABC-type transport system involved in multi-copper enzyme maturation permease subunit
MIWLAWRQFRAQAIASGAVLLVFAIVLLVSGLSLAHLYDHSGLPGCVSQHDCGPSLSGFTSQLRGSSYEFVFYFGIVLIYLAPALMGMFWGAPLIAREFEAGTFRLAWTQSISRNRWLIVKVTLVGVAAMVGAGLLSLMLNWWSVPVYKAARYAAPGSGLSLNRLTPYLFGVNGITPIGYAAFAFALGLTAGVLLRRTVPAMAVTFGGFALVQIVWPLFVRAHLLTPVRRLLPLRASGIGGLSITSDNNQLTVFPLASKPDSWVLSDQALNSAGKPFTGPATHACASGSQQACDAWLNAQHLRQLVVYQPASRYWPLQGYETAIFLAVAIALALICSVRISRRRLA